MKKLNVVVRRVVETGVLELFYVNTNHEGDAWWIEGYCKNDGHFQPAKNYVYGATKPIPPGDADAAELVKFWDSLPGHDGFTAVQGMRLNGPRHVFYSGE